MPQELLLPQAVPDRLHVTPEQRRVIKETLCPGATDAQVDLFLYDNFRRGVHPMDKKLHFTLRDGRYVAITSIDFMREQAATTGEYAGYESKFEGTVSTADFRCTVTVYRLVAGTRCSWTGTARWSEYYPGDSKQGFMWRKMPHGQLEKCAEAIALRRAFPHIGIDQIYTRDEMDQAVASSTAPLVERLKQRALEVEHQVEREGKGDVRAVLRDDGKVDSITS